MDASALVKLATREEETAALQAAVPRWERRASSLVARVEVLVVARRWGGEGGPARAELALAGVSLIDLTRELADRAGRLTGLRALDAIHLASALSLGDALDVFVAYDRRLQEVATAAGLRVLAPA